MMFNRMFGSFNVWSIGIIFSVLLILGNWLLFYSYQRSFPVEDWWTQLWNYCETDAFKAITVSLFIPIILAALGGAFKIKTAVEKRIREDRDRLIARGTDCVESTRTMWDELYRITSEVKYFKKGIDEQGEIRKIQKQLNDFCNKAEDVVNMWYFRFPNLFPQKPISIPEQAYMDTAEIFLIFINVLFNAAYSVACYIEKSEDENAISDLQKSLGNIQSGLKTIVHHNMLIILKNSVSLLPSDLSKREERTIRAEIASKIKYLETNAKLIKKEETKSNVFIPQIQGNQIEDIRGLIDEYQIYYKSNPRSSLRNWGKRKELWDSIFKIQHNSLVNGQDAAYSEECIKHLADWFSHQEITKSILDRIKWATQ